MEIERSLRPSAWLVLFLPLLGADAPPAPQPAGTPPVPSALPLPGLSPIDMGPEPLDLPVPGSVDGVTPAQLVRGSSTPASPRGPAAAAPPAAGAAAASSRRRGGGIPGAQFNAGGTPTNTTSNSPLTLNTIGDQGVIGFAPPGNHGPAVSVARNFALNITDNNSAPLQNRIIPLEYYHFFDSNRVYPGLTYAPNRFAAAIAPSQTSRTGVRTRDDRYVFGFETIVAPRMSILFRQSVVTIEEPSTTLQQGTKLHQLGGTRSGWGDLQISPKYLIHQDEKYTFTGGLGMIIPLGENSAYHQFGNDAFVFQPFLLLLAKPTDKLVLQAGFEYDVPVASNLSGVTLFRYLLFAGYKVFDEPASRNVKQVYPLIELHGSDLVGGFTQDMLNFTAGVRVNAFRKSQFGLGYSLPLTQERQYSNEILFNYNLFF